MPRTQVAVPSPRIYAEVAERHNVRISNVFHAGDGNLHPGISLGVRVCRVSWRRQKPPVRRFCNIAFRSEVRLPGEHGVGMEKNELMGRLFSADSLDYIQWIKALGWS